VFYPHTTVQLFFRSSIYNQLVFTVGLCIYQFLKFRKMKIAIIGAGNLGHSMAQGITKYNNNKLKQLIITRRKSIQHSDLQYNEKVKYINDNIAAVKESDIIILAVQPHHLEGVALEIKGFIKADKHLIISTITGKHIQKLEEYFTDQVPIIRCMPSIAISVGESMTCMSVNRVGALQLQQAEQIFNPLGQTLLIDDNMMQAATVICGSGIAFWIRLIRATMQGAIQLGFNAEEAKKLSVQTCLGSARLLIDTDNHPEMEIDKVTTPKGCTISGLNEMEHEGLSSALIKGLLKSYIQINMLH
jgi:pyrroline-5-carboxylate reductase